MTTFLLIAILAIVIINHIAVRALQMQVRELESTKEVDEDALYEEAKRIVIENGKCSTSLIQRWMKVGYARAARLIDMLEDNWRSERRRRLCATRGASQTRLNEFIADQELIYSIQPYLNAFPILQNTGVC